MSAIWRQIIEDLSLRYIFGPGGSDYAPGVSTALTEPGRFENLTIGTGVILNMDGYPVHVKETLTIATGGALARVVNNGGNGGKPTGGSAGAGASVVTRPLGGNFAGSSGAAGGTTSGGIPGSGTATSNTPYLGGATATNNTGSGGAGSAGSGSSGGIGSRGSVQHKVNNIAVYPWGGKSSVTRVSLAGGAGGGGGGGGGGNSTNTGGGGGGGGAGGGVAWVAAKRIVIEGTGVISANGGDGGNGSPASKSDCGGGGGGSGGSGGCVVVICEEIELASTIDTHIIALPGAPGVGGTGLGVGVDGGDGKEQSPGQVIVYNAKTGLFLLS